MHSPIKTWSARRKDISSQKSENGALRGVKVPGQIQTMILLTLNIRGVGGSLKTASFRRLLAKTSPNIIFLQETMASSHKSRSFLNQFHPSWLTSSVDSIGTSSGLAVSWDPTFFYLTSHLCCGGILLTGTCLWNSNPIFLLNVYGPCSERRLFWDKVANQGLLDHANLILAGDLNLTTSAGKIWGPSTSTDPLASFFNNLFQSHALVDISPSVIVPTWRNGRVGTASIQKRLDRAFVTDSLISPKSSDSLLGGIPLFLRPRTGSPPT
jgi:endonuclease/exonuclease/phosphatase family metal-dependent hydrolase